MAAVVEPLRLRRRTQSSEGSLQWLTWLITATLVISPLAPLLYASFRDRPLYLHGGVFTLHAYRQLLSDPAFWRAGLNTLAFATLSTAIAVGGGVTIAVLCARTDIPARRVISWLAVAPVALPPLGLLLGWIVVWGPGGYAASLLSGRLGINSIDLTTIPGMAIIGGTATLPIVYLICSASLSRTDASLEDVARSSGAGPYRTIFRVTIPLLRPAALNAGLLVFTLSAETLGLPLLLGQSRNTYFVSSYLYTQWTSASSPDPPSVSAGAVILLIFASLLLVVRNRLLGSESRFVAISSQGGTRHRLRLGRVGYLCCLVVLVFLFLSTALPVGGLALMSVVGILTPLIAPWRELTWSNYNAVFHQPLFTRSITNSLTIALVGAAATTIVVAMATLVAHRSSFRLRHSMQFLIVYPRAIPGIVLGMGFFWAYLLFNPPGHFLLSSFWGILLAFSVHSITLTYLVLYPAMSRIGRPLDNAARSVGATWWRASTRIVLALMWPAILAAFLITFIAIMNNYEPALFLVKPGNEVMGVTMLSLFQQGITGPVSALAMIQLSLTVVIALAAGWLLRRNLRRGDA